MTLCTSLTRSRFFHSLRRLCVGAQMWRSAPPANLVSKSYWDASGYYNPQDLAKASRPPLAERPSDAERRNKIKIKSPFEKGGMREMWVMIGLSMGRKRRGCPKDLRLRSLRPAEKKAAAYGDGRLHVWFEFLLYLCDKDSITKTQERLGSC